MQKIIIIGAGLVGSLLAVYMAKKGYKVRVYERRPDMRQQDIEGNRSINLALSDRGWRALEAVGLADDVQNIAIPMFGRMVHTEDGAQNFQPYGKSGQAICSVSRSELNKILMNAADAMPNVRFYFNIGCTKIDLKNNTVHLQDVNKGYQYIKTADVIFGADGAFSKVRSGMQRTIGFNYSQEFLPHGYKELSIPPTAEGKHIIDKNALHIWPRKSYMLIALPNPDGSFTCTLFLAYKGNPSFELLETPEAVQAFFEQHFASALKHMPNLTEEFFQNPTSSLVTIRCNPWVKNNRFALIGDASHAIVPFYGQGMNSGFEDCYVFNQVVNKYIATASSPDGSEEATAIDWPAILQDYQALRIPDANAIADLALRNFIEMRDLVIDDNFLLRKRIEKQLQEKYNDKYLPLYSMVTFSDMRYSEALAMGKQQDKYFNELLAQPNIEEKWQAGDLEAHLDNMVAQLMEFSHNKKQL